MRAYEFITEGIIDSKIINDDIGGFIKITPDPDKYSDFTKFSISYITKKMTSYYGVNHRILGIDSHGHKGFKEPHLHMLQKSKIKGYLDIDFKNFDFNLALSIFYDLVYFLRKQYKDSI